MSHLTCWLIPGGLFFLLMLALCFYIFDTTGEKVKGILCSLILCAIWPILILIAVIVGIYATIKEKTSENSL